MNDSNKTPGIDPPVTPTEDRLGRFLEEAMDLAERGAAIDVSALLADRSDLIDRGRRLVSGLESLRRAGTPAWSPGEERIPDPFPGEFRVLRSLGEGSFGKVWLADDLNLCRQVALKTLHLSAAANPSALAALRKEASILGGLDHRNVVKVWTWRQSLGGENYLVLEYVAGGSLADLMRSEGPLPWQRAARYIANVAEGLREVHAHGIIHRDIKASNTLWDPSRDEAKLTDFGVAGWLGATRTAAGTPVFMAPEAFQGRATEASDVYGLAATLFHLMTGELPFPATTLNALADKGARGLPQTDARFQQVPRRLEGIIRAGLAVDQADRPSLSRFIDLLWGALNQTLVDEMLPRVAEEETPHRVGLRMEVSRRVESGWQSVATTQPPADSMSRDVRRVPPRPAQARVRTGEPLRLEVEADRPGYLAVYNVGPTGNLNLLYPVVEYGDSPRIEAGQAVRFEDLVLDPPAGRERMLAVWSSKPLPVSAEDLRGLVEEQQDDRSRAARSSRDIVRMWQAVAGTEDCRVVVLELEHEPLA